MMLPIVHLALARVDVQQAEEYYYLISPVLGQRFMAEVAQCEAYIRQNPGGFQRVKGLYRQAPLEVFPYVITYIPFDEEIVVFRIFHTAQQPRKRFRRK